MNMTIQPSRRTQQRPAFIYPGIICLLVTLLAACANEIKDPYMDYRGDSDIKIYEAAQKQLKTEAYRAAAESFEALEALYPFSDYTKKGRLDIIYAHFKADDTESALAAADRYLHLYPNDKDADYAYYMRGIARFYQDRPPLHRYLKVDRAMRDLGPAKQAFSDFSTLLAHYPDSRYAPDVKMRMVFLRELLARQDVVVANYYLRRRAFIAAVNRADHVVRHFQRAPSVADALVVMVKSYRALGMDQQADKSLRVLQTNMPKHPELPRLLRSAAMKSTTVTKPLLSPNQHSLPELFVKSSKPAVKPHAPQLKVSNKQVKQVKVTTNQIVMKQAKMTQLSSRKTLFKALNDHREAAFAKIHQAKQLRQKQAQLVKQQASSKSKPVASLSLSPVTTISQVSTQKPRFSKHNAYIGKSTTQASHAKTSQHNAIKRTLRKIDKPVVRHS